MGNKNCCPNDYDDYGNYCTKKFDEFDTWTCYKEPTAKRCILTDINKEKCTGSDREWKDENKCILKNISTEKSCSENNGKWENPITCPINRGCPKNNGYLLNTNLCDRANCDDGKWINGRC